MVQDVHGFTTTSKDLSAGDAAELIRRMEEMAAERGAEWTPRATPPGLPLNKGRGRQKYDELGKRYGMATARQLRKIEAMWKDVSRATNAVDREKALRSFLMRMVKVSAMEFVESAHAHKLIKALEQIKKDKPQNMEKERGK
jgi:hypothetical protein